DREIERFHEAIELVRVELKRIRGRVSEDLGDELAGIFEAQSLFLSDGTFLERVEGHIVDEKINAEWAIYETATEIQAQFDAIGAEYLRERSEDLRDVCRHLVRQLRGIHLHHLSEIEGDVVIVADDLSPTDAVRFGRENVVGFAIEHGSRTSHTTIIARSLNLPAVSGLTDIRKRLTDQAEVPIIVDGSAGEVVLRPTAEVLRGYRHQISVLVREEENLLEQGRSLAVSTDGVEVRVMANIDLPEEIDDAVRFGSEGVGLYRSEFLYIEKSPAMPEEDEQVEAYRRLIEAAAPHPAIVRTYDLGGRKIAREVMYTHEENPVLGLRGIRLTLARREIFRTQLRALYRAAVYGDLWIMLPMVTVVEEVRGYRAFAAEIQAELDAENLAYRDDCKLGIMIEVPAAALIADLLAREVDFFSIGTNDLIQYALAVDRNNEHVTDLYQPGHPGMVRLLRQIARAANREGIELSMCGEMAADPRLTPLLLGIGLRRLSVSPRKVPTIKNRICELSTRTCEDMVEQCTHLATGAEVDQFLLDTTGAVHSKEGST
ncbi:MAG: phosphoenolpyruvate--protein phosphotransferase, partial [Acidobacteriota bacterium]